MTQITTIRVSEHCYAQGLRTKSPILGKDAVTDGKNVYVGTLIEGVRK